MTNNFYQPNQLNLNLFSSDLRYLLEDTQHRFQAPMPIVVSAMMTTLAVSMQEIVTVKMPNGVSKPVSLAIATIAESGDRKTSVHQEFMKPIYGMDQQAEIDFGKQLEVFEAEQNLYKIKEQILRDDLVKAFRKETESQLVISEKWQKHIRQKPDRPVLNTRCHSNTTIAALLKNMADCAKSKLFISSEAGGNVNNWTKEDIANLIQLIDGETIKVDRVTTGSFYISGKKLSCSLSFQPSIYDQIISKKGTVLMDSGLLPRMLISSSYSLQGYRSQIEQTHSTYMGAFHERIEELLQCPNDLDSNHTSITMQFDNQATRAWLDYANHLERSIAVDGYYRDVKYWATRMGDNVARFAALIEFYRNGVFDKSTQYISLHSLQMALALGDFWLNEAKKLFGDSSAPQKQLALANQLLEYLRRNYNPNNLWYTKKQLYSNGPRELRNSVTAQTAIETLMQQGFLGTHPQNANVYGLTEKFFQVFNLVSPYQNNHYGHTNSYGI